MYVCPEIQVIFLSQPRTASRSCAAFLKAHTPVRTVGGHHDMDIAELRFRKRDGWRVVTAVRNHYDILVSWWHHNPYWFGRQRGIEPSFDRYVRQFTFHAKNKYARPHKMYWRFQPEATHIVRYENLWDDLSAAVGIPAPMSARPAIGVSNRKPYSEYFDDETRLFIADYYTDEIAEYGYEF